MHLPGSFLLPREQRFPEPLAGEVEGENGDEEGDAGNSVRCQYSSGLSNAWRSSPPQLAVGGWTPKPRKLRPLSARIAPATPKVKLMRMGPVMFGSRWTVIVRQAEMPTTSQLWMYGSARCLSTSPRTRNVSPIQPVSPITAMTTRIDWLELAVFQDRHQNQQKQEGRETEQDFHEAHDRQVEPAAIIAGHQPDQGADDQRDRRSEEPDRQRSARAVNHAAGHIAADLVGAEPVLPGGLLIGLGDNFERSIRNRRENGRSPDSAAARR